MLHRNSFVSAGLANLVLMAACGDDDDPPAPSTGGTSGRGGSSGASGRGGSAEAAAAAPREPVGSRDLRERVPQREPPEAQARRSVEAPELRAPTAQWAALAQRDRPVAAAALERPTPATRAPMRAVSARGSATNAMRTISAGEGEAHECHELGHGGDEAMCAAKARSALLVFPGRRGAAPVPADFGAKFGTEAFSCTGTYTGVGTDNSTVKPVDLRFYVQNVRLITAGGTETAVTLVAERLSTSLPALR